jgi:hypothetical protein
LHSSLKQRWNVLKWREAGVSSIFGGGSSSSGSTTDSSNLLSSLGNTVSSLFSSMGTTTGNAASAVGDAAGAVNPVSSADAAQMALDPTGSISAQTTIDPPSAGSAADQESSIGGTQSGAGTQQNQQGTQQNQQGTQQNNQYAPVEAVDSLKKALAQLTQQQRQNPWQPEPPPKGMDRATRMPVPPLPAPQATPPVLPQLSAGDIGASDAANLAGAGAIPASVANAPAPDQYQPLPGAMAAGYGGIGSDATASPVADAAEASTPPQPGPTATPTGPAAPSTTGGKPTPATDDQGRAITVHKAQPGATDAAKPLPTKTAATTTKRGLIPEPNFPADPNQPSPSPMMRDVTGGQSVPPALAQLARAALPIVLPMLLSAALSRRGGGFRHFGGFHPGGGGHWPYHNPMQGWQMHDHHPGGGWRPMDPSHMRHLGIGGQREWEQGDVHPGGALIMQALYGNGPQGIAGQPAAGGGQPGGYPPGMRNDDAGGADTEFDPANVPTGSTERGTPGVSAAQYDGFARNYASQIGLNPDVVSRVLATESSFGQNIYGDYENGRPTSFGGFQLHLSPDGKAMGNQYMRQTGHAPWDHKYWQEQVKFALDQMKKGGLRPWKTTMNKLGYGEWSANAAPTRQASAPPPTTQQGPEAAAAPG